MLFFFFSSRRRHTRYIGDWSSDVCSSDVTEALTVTLGNLTEGVMRSRVCWFSMPGGLNDPRPLVSVRDRLALKGLRAVGVCSGRNQGGTMPFSQSFRRPSPSPARARGPVLAVGRRVYVARS